MPFSTERYLLVQCRPNVVPNQNLNRPGLSPAQVEFDEAYASASMAHAAARKAVALAEASPSTTKAEVVALKTKEDAALARMDGLRRTLYRPLPPAAKPAKPPAEPAAGGAAPPFANPFRRPITARRFVSRPKWHAGTTARTGASRPRAASRTAPPGR